MHEINIANSRGRDAQVALESVVSAKQIRWLDDKQRQASSARYAKATLHYNLQALTDRYGDLTKVGQEIIAGDPEVDLESTGRFLRETARVYVDKNRGIVRNVQFFEVIKNGLGS